MIASGPFALANSAGMRNLYAAVAALTVAVGLAAPAAADPGDTYNAGLASAVCQLLDQGWTPQRVAAELAASFPPEIVADETAGRAIVTWAVNRGC